MIEPNFEAAKTYLGSGTVEHLAEQILRGAPWFCEQVGVDFLQWSRDILTAKDFPGTAALHLVGSAANGFSLAPEKAGAPFRMLQMGEKPSDLDFCLVDQQLFMQAWDSIVREDQVLHLNGRFDAVRIRVYWGRIEQSQVPQVQRARLRTLIDTIRRTPEYRGYSASIRVYRRRQDLLGYTLWCLAKLKRAIGQ